MSMPGRLLVFVFLVAMVSAGLPIQAAPRPADAAAMRQIFLPVVQTTRPPNPFGFDLSVYSSNTVLEYGQATNPRWARGGDMLWSKVEPVRGAGYIWDSLKLVDANIQRLRAAGIEPTIIIQQSPSWAQSVPGVLCSPPKPEYLEDFAKFVYSLVSRYSSGPLQVNYWEIWNEPDFANYQVDDNAGVGCWGNSSPDNGGTYYGKVLRRIYPAIKAANPAATVFAGALASFGVDDPRNERFLRGMLSNGLDSFDALSFHAYGEWSANDLLLIKTTRFRRILQEFNRGNKPLVVTEVAATCERAAVESCRPNYNEWLYSQANFAARIYAEAIALDLLGAFWYTLGVENPGFAYSHIVDVKNGQAIPRPAYYAFRNSAQILEGARYIGPPMKELNDSQLEEVQQLAFRKGTTTLYVLWVPKLDFPKIPYEIRVKPGATAICTQSLQLDVPSRYMCSDTNKDGVIRLAVGPLPYYVEVID